MGRESQVKGASLEHEIAREFGAREGVVLWRNQVAKATLRTGAQMLTGIGGKGAPDFLIEVRDHAGRWLALWVESKCGEYAALTKEQRAWHDAARALGRHVVLARSLQDVIDAVCWLRAGMVP